MLGGHVQGVDVALDGVAEPDGGILLLSQQGACRSWGVVSGQDVFEQLGRGGGAYRVGPDEGVRVAVADQLQVDVVAEPSPGAHGVQLLPRLGTGDQAVHGVGGDPLGGVNRGGVAEFNGVAYVAGGQVDGAAAPAVLYPQPAVPISSEDGPPVAVLHPVRGGGAEPAVIATGDDQLAGTGPVSVRQARPPVQMPVQTPGGGRGLAG